MSDNLNKALSHYIGLKIIETQCYFSKPNLMNYNVKFDELREKYHDENPRFPSASAKLSPLGYNLPLGRPLLYSYRKSIGELFRDHHDQL